MLPRQRHPGAIERRWTRERALEAMHEWRSRYRRLPSSYDWSRSTRVAVAASRSSDSAQATGLPPAS